jgi:molybdenum cofactor cytidylyltransferase
MGPVRYAGAPVKRVACIVAAAGASSRFGAAKQLALVDGKPLLLHGVEAAAAAGFDPIIVVLGSSNETVAPLLRTAAVLPVVNPAWELGLGSSIACGAAHVPSESDAVVILLADQYGITPDHLRLLRERWMQNPGHMIVTQTVDASGPPVLFPASCLPALRLLTGDQGARSVLLQHPDLIDVVPAPAAMRDIDRPADLL